VLFAGRYNAMYESTDRGASWFTSTLGQSYEVEALQVSDPPSSPTMLLAGTVNGLLLSSDSGSTWTFALSDNGKIGPFVSNGPVIIAGDERYDFAVSIDYGHTWHTSGGNGGGEGVLGSAYFGGFLFTSVAQGMEGGPCFLYRSSFADYAKYDVQQTNQPTSFTLNQNYPNPFNPSTSITYTLAARSTMKLEVFDMLGRKIETLMDGVIDAGSHNVKFDRANLPSGVYTVELSAGGLKLGMKMSLEK